MSLTNDEKEDIEWAQSHNIKRLKYDNDSIEVEFWSPTNNEEKKVNITELLAAPITEDELLGYDPPDHLKDPDDIDISKKDK